MRVRASRIGISVAALTLWAAAPAGEALGPGPPHRGRGRRRRAAGRRPHYHRSARATPAHSLGNRRPGSERQAEAGALSGHATAVLGPVVKEILGAGGPLLEGGPIRQNVGGLVRDLLANRAADGDLLPLSRRRPAGAGPASADAVSPSGRAAARCGLAPRVAGGMVARLRPPAAALVRKEVRLPAAGGQLPDDHLGAAAELAASAREANRLGLRPAGARGRRDDGDRIDSHRAASRTASWA